MPNLSAPACRNRPAAAGGWRKAALLCLGAATTVLAGCAGGYSGGNPPALGQGGSGMGVAGSSGNGVQMYGTADISYGSSRTVTRSGASSRTGL